MQIDFHRNFDKRFTKLSKKQQDQFRQRLKIFAGDYYDPTLNNHSLKGKFQGYRSMNVTGDIRAIFILHEVDHVEFVDIGSHSELYS